MSDREDSDNEAPEEFTAEQGVQVDKEIRKAQKDNKKRVAQEGKQRRKKWAERLTPRVKKKVVQDESNQDPEAEPNDNGMLPAEIVNFLAAKEKQVFSSDSEEEKNAEQKLKPKTKKANTNGPAAIILNDLPPPHCLQNSLDFLKKRKMQVPRSDSVLNNSHKALRLMTSSGLL